MATTCTECNEESNDIRLAIVTMDKKKYLGDLWMCEKCGAIFTDSGKLVQH